MSSPPTNTARTDSFRRQPEYDLRAGAARVRIFAEHYQFLLFDPAEDPFRPPLPRINKATSLRGWTRTEHAIWIYTRADFLDHRIDVSLADQYQTDPIAARQTVHNLTLPDGLLALFEHPNHVRFRVPPGPYKVYCRAYSLGSEDPHGSADLSDDEFFRHGEWERYEIILVPGSVDKEGEL
jgi:hypothetical protein